jgi:hypothetical protein
MPRFRFYTCQFRIETYGNASISVEKKVLVTAGKAFLKQDTEVLHGGGSTSQSVRDVSDPAHPQTVQTFNGVTSIVTDNARLGLLELTKKEFGFCRTSSTCDAISAAGQMRFLLSPTLSRVTQRGISLSECCHTATPLRVSFITSARINLHSGNQR